MPMHFTPLGDHAVTITLGDSIDEATHRLVRAVSAHLDAHPPGGMVDLVPAFASVAVHYDPARVPGSATASPHHRMVAMLEASLATIRADELPPPRTVEIPVCYGGDLGPDLDDVARQHGLAAEEVVRIHAAGDYLVYMVGFMPGFAYLGGLSDRIATPRRPSPRTAVPAGAVGIGGQQTGVYPMESPGGWNLIGRTPLRIFDIARDEPSLLATGDRVRFRPVTLDEYRASGAP
ncbi:MAG: allophanate hydrolase subunit 1 [Gemmatimonadetes bacterium]|nr:allophanate hydrolase subunit 1 [Gemmatimonadota bacterium]